MTSATAPGEQTSAAGAAPSAAEPIPLATPSPASEACPLCATPLGPDQDWCLRCGAAARTRLAATPNWKAPIVAIAVVAVIALGVLAAALVKLAGGSSAASPPVTTTITAAAAPATTPAAAAPSSATTTPGAAATTPSSATTTTPGVAGAQGAATVTTTPGAPGSTTVTTLTPAQREAQRQAASPLSTK